MHSSDLKYFIRDIEFRWVIRKSVIDVEAKLGYNITKEENVLQYKVQKGDGFRGWSDWKDVRNEYETSK